MLDSLSLSFSVHVCVGMCVHARNVFSTVHTQRQIYANCIEDIVMFILEQRTECRTNFFSLVFMVGIISKETIESSCMGKYFFYGRIPRTHTKNVRIIYR